MLPQKVHVNLSCGLLGLYLLFIVGVDRTEWPNICMGFAVSLHYFLLVSIAWMGIEAFIMYLMFIKVLNSYTPKLLLKLCIVGWGKSISLNILNKLETGKRIYINYTRKLLLQFGLVSRNQSLHMHATCRIDCYRFKFINFKCLSNVLYVPPL